VREELDIPMPSMGPSYRVPRQRDTMDPNTKRLALIAGGIGGTLLLLVGGWSLVGRHHGGVPVVEADSGPLRVRPANPGGLQVAGQDESILGGSGAGDKQAALAPAPEVPALQALRAQERQAAAPASPSMAAQPVSLNAVQSAEAPPADPPAAPAPPPAPKVAAPAAVRPSPAMDAKPVSTAAAKRGPVARPVAPVTGHGVQVQLAALASEQGAMLEWQRLAKKDPDLFGGRTPSVLRVEREGKVFWRLRTGGFTDLAQASNFCERIKSRGAGCSVASF
jgi:SPOR domain